MKNTKQDTGKINLYWRVNTGELLKEIANNAITKDGAILKIPLNMFQSLLAQVGERAAELNDPKLNALMCRLAIYAESDPCNPDYNEKLTNETINKIYN